MPATPRTSGRKAREGSVFLADVLARNIRDYRVLRGLSQGELAGRMAVLGHSWIRATVSNVETAKRSVSVDELAGLAVCMGVTIGDLLDAGGVRGDQTAALDLGAGAPMDIGRARLLAHGRACMAITWEDERPTGWKYSVSGDAPDPLGIMAALLPPRLRKMVRLDEEGSDQ